MLREIFPDLYQIPVSLPLSHLTHVNAYLIKAEDGNLLIDTGMNLPGTFQTLCKRLSEVHTKPKDLSDIFVTHFHVDHVGLLSFFKHTSKSIRLFIHDIEKTMSRQLARSYDDINEDISKFMISYGMAANECEKLSPALYNPQAYQELAVSAHSIHEGQRISRGRYTFQIVHTPGHSPGHLSLYEPKLKLLISGDSLLPTITPHIGVWWFMRGMNPLKDYVNTLQKIERLDIESILPAHEYCFHNHRNRIQQLRNHHKNRLLYIFENLRTEKLTPYRLASLIDWNSRFYKSWDNFPYFQKMLALGETVAHLEFLDDCGLIEKVDSGDQVVHFRINEQAVTCLESHLKKNGL